MTLRRPVPLRGTRPARRASTGEEAARPAARAEGAGSERVAGAHAAGGRAPRGGGEELQALRLSLRRLHLLDELRWRRYSLARGGYSGRAAKRLALLDAEIARREEEYVASLRRNGAGPGAPADG